MTAVNNFVDYQLNDDFNQTDFIAHLYVLIPAFQVFDQEDVDYCTSVSAFRNMMQFVEVDRYYVAVAALKALADEGKLPASRVAEAIARYGIDADKPASWLV